ACLFCISIQCLHALTHLSSVPTRRSSDLLYRFHVSWSPHRIWANHENLHKSRRKTDRRLHHREVWMIFYRRDVCGRRDLTNSKRSEEHTSELQSHLNLVCRLLLEKKYRRC